MKYTKLMGLTDNYSTPGFFEGTSGERELNGLWFQETIAVVKSPLRPTCSSSMLGR